MVIFLYNLYIFVWIQHSFYLSLNYYIQIPVIMNMLGSGSCILVYRMCKQSIVNITNTYCFIYKNKKVSIILSGVFLGNRICKTFGICNLLIFAYILLPGTLYNSTHNFE